MTKSKTMFQYIGGEGYIDGTPCKPLVERAKSYGWISGPDPSTVRIEEVKDEDESETTEAVFEEPEKGDEN